MQLLITFIAKFFTAVGRLPGEFLRQSLATRIASVVAAVLVTAVFLAGMAMVLQGETQLMPQWWYPGRVILILLLLALIPLCVYQAARYWLMRDNSLWPDIDASWTAALAELSRQQIDIRNTPLFVLLGSDGRDVEQSLMRDTTLAFKVYAAPPGSAPLHIYGSSEGIILCLSDIGQTSLVCSRLRSAETVRDPAPAEMSGGNWSPATSADLLSAAERKVAMNRLQAFSTLLLKTRDNIAAINGVAVVVPISLQSDASHDFAAMGDAVGEDLLLLQESLGLRAPVSFFIDIRGGDQSLEPVLSNLSGEQRSMAVGQPFPPGATADPYDTVSVAIRSSDALHDVVTRFILGRTAQGSLTAAEAANNRRALKASFETRMHVVPRATAVVSNALAMVARNSDRSLFTGMYLIHSHAGDRQSFVRGAFQRVLDLQGELAWTQSTLRNEHWRRRAATVLMILDAVIVATLALIFWMRMRAS
jgi:uncharacterized membrane protein